MTRGRWLKTAIITLAAFWVGSQHAQAGLIGVAPVSGAPGQIIPAPGSVQADGVASDTFQLGFDELQGVTLPRDLETDQGVIPAGTIVSSHMILLHHASGTSFFSAVNDWTFDGLILGTMSDSGGLLEADSTDLLGLPLAFYPGGFAHRGLEGNDFLMDLSPNQLRVGMKATQPGDWIRVVTTGTTIPEPSSVALLGVGLACLLRARHVEKRFYRRSLGWR